VQSEKAKPVRKQNLMRNSLSRSHILESMISRRWTAHRYYNAGLISKVSEDISCKKAENCHCGQPHCRFTPPLRETSTNIRINLMSPETRVIGLHFCRRQYGSIFIQIFVVGSERCIFSATEYISAVQGHPRSLILAPIERAYATSY